MPLFFVDESEYFPAHSLHKEDEFEDMPYTIELTKEEQAAFDAAWTMFVYWQKLVKNRKKHKEPKL